MPAAPDQVTQGNTSQPSSPCLRLLLQRCPHLRSVRLGRTVSLTDQDLADILADNPLRYLETFHLAGSENCQLSVSGAELLVAVCPRLASLTDLSSWQGVFPREVESLRQQARDNNWELSLGADLEWVCEEGLRRAGLKEKFDRLREQFGDMVMIP